MNCAPQSRLCPSTTCSSAFALAMAGAVLAFSLHAGAAQRTYECKAEGGGFAVSIEPCDKYEQRTKEAKRIRAEKAEKAQRAQDAPPRANSYEDMLRKVQEEQRQRRHQWLSANPKAPESIRRGVEFGRAVLGMDSGAVRAALGEPDDVRTITSGRGFTEFWHYRRFAGMTTIHFSNYVVDYISE